MKLKDIRELAEEHSFSENDEVEMIVNGAQWPVTGMYLMNGKIVLTAGMNPEATACECENGIVRSLGRDNDEIIEDCPRCSSPNTNVQRRSGDEPASPSVLKPTDQPPTPERSL